VFPQATFHCKTWIWVDLVTLYVELLIKFRARASQAQGDAAMKELEQKLERKSEEVSCREMELVEQGLAHQIKISEYKTKILTLQSQLDKQISNASKWEKLRLLMVMFVAACWLTTPDSLLITLGATCILALMFAV
jgi:hypothetical protein